MVVHHSVICGTGKDRECSKDKGLLNVFEGAYDHTNDKMHVHCYKKKTAKQFVDFLKRVDRRYIMIRTSSKISLLYLIIYQQCINQRR